MRSGAGVSMGLVQGTRPGDTCCFGRATRLPLPLRQRSAARHGAAHHLLHATARPHARGPLQSAGTGASCAAGRVHGTELSLETHRRDKARQQVEQLWLGITCEHVQRERGLLCALLPSRFEGHSKHTLSRPGAGLFAPEGPAAATFCAF
jgi:hypothetical protein